MARIFITGSSDGLGLGLGAARILVEQGHAVTLHARNETRARHAKNELPQVEGLIVGDLADRSQVQKIAEEANSQESFDAVIHNAGVYVGSANLADINLVAPYLLTAYMRKPKRLIYLSSGAHRAGNGRPIDFDNMTYADSKLDVIALALAVARTWPETIATAVDPGWVRTKMGGSSAPRDVAAGSATQAWLAASNEPSAQLTGTYFYDKSPQKVTSPSDDIDFQDELITALRKRTGVALPA